MRNITQETLKDNLHYNSSTGIFTRITDTSNGIKAGDVAGFKNKAGYIIISIKNIQFRSHRLAWLYMYGYMPESIDHINHITTDNRIKNLREVSQKTNCRNCSLSRLSTSGVMGVSLYKRTNRWKASIWVDGRNIHLGYYKEKNNAIIARNEANIKHGFHKNHGIKRGATC